jgi:porphobilinogen synthase
MWKKRHMTGRCTLSIERTKPYKLGRLNYIRIKFFCIKFYNEAVKLYTSAIKKTKAMIRLVRPIDISTNDLVYPIFVREDGRKYGINSMNGQEYLSLDNAVEVCEKAMDLGIPAVMIFGMIKNKDADSSVALRTDGFHSKIFKRLKSEFGENLTIISNVCLCDYTDEGYCVYTEKGKVLNEKTAQMLGKIATVHAEAGADVVAPAAMADGQVKHIRAALDSKGFDDIAIMTYVKTNSCLFNPFYVTMAESNESRKGIDPSKFRVDPINDKMFLQKVNLDVSEGADIVIVKPALTNLDLIARVKQRYPDIPVAAYQVSGEYAMIESSAEKGFLNKEALLTETLSSIKRAGADMILTYYSLEVAKLLKAQR